MRRLTRINNTQEGYSDSSVQISTQMCMHNSSKLSCQVLKQMEDASESQVDMKYYNAYIPQRKQHLYQTPLKMYKKHLCGQCESHDITKVMNRLGVEEDMLPTATRQLSTGKPFRISPSRMLYSHLRRAVCHADTNCTALHNTIIGKIPESEMESVCGSEKACLTREYFTKALLYSHRYTHNSTQVHTDKLWNRNWVYCPYSLNSKTPCMGTVSKETWLDPTQRAGACANTISEVRQHHVER